MQKIVFGSFLGTFSWLLRNARLWAHICQKAFSVGLLLCDLIQFWAREGERLIIRGGCLFEGWCLSLFQLIFKFLIALDDKKIIKTRQEMVRLKELWAHMYISVSTSAISLRISSHWTRQTREPTTSLAALAKSFLKV